MDKMASKSECYLAEKQGKNTTDAPIVILDSDEEGEQTTSELFQGFLKAAQPFLERKEVLLLRVKFAELRPEYASCAKFKEMLRRKANQVRENDVYIHFNEIFNELIDNAAVYATSVVKNHDREITTSGESTSVTLTELDEAPKFEKHTDQQHCNGKVAPTSTTSTQSTSSNRIHSQVIDLENQSALQDFDSPNKSHNLSKEDQLRRKKRKHRIAKMETKLKYLSDEIKRLSQTDLSLEEMDLADSNYLRESKLKTKFNKLWNKICELKGRPPNTGRVVEQKITIKETKFPAIDKAMQKFLKRKRGFPDIFDVLNVIIRANKKHHLGLSPSVLHEIATDVFTDIGSKIQKKRKKDFEYNFGCHMTDDYVSSMDPALNNVSLRRKLEENKKVNERALDSVFEKYVHLGRTRGQNKCDDEYSDSSSVSSTDCAGYSEKNSRKKTRRKKRGAIISDNEDEDWRFKRVKLRDKLSDSITSSTTETVKINVNNFESTCNGALSNDPLKSVKDENIPLHSLQSVKPDSSDINRPNEQSTQSSANLVNSNPSLNDKLNINTSKLHLKIEELRSKQLSLQVQGQSATKLSVVYLSKPNALVADNSGEQDEDSANTSNNTDSQIQTTLESTNGNLEINVALDKATMPNVAAITQQSKVLLSPSTRKVLSQTESKRGISSIKNINDSKSCNHTISDISITPACLVNLPPLRKPLFHNNSQDHSPSRINKGHNCLRNKCTISNTASPPKRVCPGLSRISVGNGITKADTVKVRETVIILSDDED